MEKLINNNWDGEVDCPEVKGPVVSFLKKRLQQLSKDYKLEKHLVLLVW